MKHTDPATPAIDDATTAVASTVAVEPVIDAIDGGVLAPERIRVAAYAFCRDAEGRVLLAHIAPSVGVGDVWTLPGGGLAFGEAPATACVRELREETGYVGEVARLLDVSDRVFEPAVGGERLHAIRVLYEVRIVGGELRPESDGSTDRAQWFDPAAARRLRLGGLARTSILQWANHAK